MQQTNEMKTLATEEAEKVRPEIVGTNKSLFFKTVRIK